MKKTANLQDIFLTKARKQGVPLTVFLVNGFQMRGSVTGFDSFTVVLSRWSPYRRQAYCCPP